MEYQVLLDRNENQFGPAPACFEVLRRADGKQLSVYSRDYERKVKSRLSERLAATFGLPENRVLLSYGSEDMLKQAVHCYLSAGENILIPNLSWWYYQSVASEVNGITVEYPIHEGPSKFSYDVEEILGVIKTHRPRAVLLASPNNPTGHSLLKEDLRTLLESSGETLIILDEAYAGFSIEDRTNAAPLISEYDNLLILRTFSKFYALAGVRIGYALAGRNLKRLIQYSARYLGYNRLSEELALAALESTEYYNEMKSMVVKERENSIHELRQLSGWKPFLSDANFILARIPQGAYRSLKQSLDEKGIAIKYYAEGILSSTVRITVGREDQNRLLLDALKEFTQAFARVEKSSR
jgi:histidinol-phosphate aminotransferase